MDGVILTELIAVLLSVLLIDFVAIVAVRCIIKKARDRRLGDGCCQGLSDSHRVSVSR